MKRHKNFKKNRLQAPKRFWEVVSQMDTTTGGCYQLLSQYNPELADALLDGTLPPAELVASTDEHKSNDNKSYAGYTNICHADAILKAAGFFPVGWAGGSYDERKGFYNANEDLRAYLDDVVSYPSVRINLLASPERQLQEGSPVFDDIVKGVNIGLHSTKSELLIFFRTNDNPPKLASAKLTQQWLHDTVLNLQPTRDDDIKAIDFGSLFVEAEKDSEHYHLLLKSILQLLHSTIASHNGDSYFGVWNGLYIARHLSQAAAYAVADDNEQTGIRKLPILHRFYMQKADIEANLTVVNRPALDAPASSMYAKELQNAAAAKNSVKLLYGLERGYDGDVETSDDTELFIVGLGTPKKVMMLPMSVEFSKLLINASFPFDTKYKLPLDNEEGQLYKRAFDQESSQELATVFERSQRINLDINDSGELVINGQHIVINSLTERYRIGAPMIGVDNLSDDDKLMRLLMRKPNHTVYEKICKIHRTLSKLLLNFIAQRDEKRVASLEWLRLASASDARGGFTDVSKLISFLRHEPKKMSSSALITQIGTIITALAYRWIECRHLESIEQEPLQAAKEHKELLDLMSGFINGHIVDHIGIAYPGRRDKHDIVSDQKSWDLYNTNDETVRSKMICGMSRAISQPSDLDELEIDSRPGRLMFAYSIVNGKKKPTFPKIALDTGVAFRNHISSGLPLDLAVCEGLLGISPKTFTAYDELTLKMFAANVFLPHYARADYHSWAESWAAVEYFTDVRMQRSMCQYMPSELVARARKFMMGLCNDQEFENAPSQVRRKK